MSSEILKSLFEYKSWADRELFELLASVEPEHAEQLHTSIRTLNHIYVVDRIFKAHLNGESRPFDATNTQTTPSLAQLWTEVAATNTWYEQYVTNLSPSSLVEVIVFEFTDGDRGKMSREEILLHIAMHGGYHRGNVGQVLKSISLMPPRDLYTKFLHLSEPTRRKA